MVPLTLPLRDEYKELLPSIELLQTVADSIGEAPIGSLRQGIDEAYEFLTHHLLPQAQAEEQALYPVVGRLMRASEATATMIRDHIEVDQLTEELWPLRSHLVSEAMSVDQEEALRRMLYGLYAVVKLYFAKEEEVYLPILDVRLTPEEASRMFEAMEIAAKQAKSRLG